MSGRLVNSLALFKEIVPLFLRSVFGVQVLDVRTAVLRDAVLLWEISILYRRMDILTLTSGMLWSECY